MCIYIYTYVSLSICWISELVQAPWAPHPLSTWRTTQVCAQGHQTERTSAWKQGRDVSETWYGNSEYWYFKQHAGPQTWKAVFAALQSRPVAALKKRVWYEFRSSNKTPQECVGARSCWLLRGDKIHTLFRVRACEATKQLIARTILPSEPSGIPESSYFIQISTPAGMRWCSCKRHMRSWVEKALQVFFAFGDLMDLDGVLQHLHVCTMFQICWHTFQQSLSALVNTCSVVTWLGWVGVSSIGRQWWNGTVWGGLDFLDGSVEWKWKRRRVHMSIIRTVWLLWHKWQKDVWKTCEHTTFQTCPGDTNKQTDRQTDRQTHRSTNKQKARR